MRVLHILDHSLPLQSGYVTRTRGILTAQRGLGVETFQLTTPRQNRVAVAEEQVDDLLFYRTPAPTGPLAGLPILSYWAEMKATERRLDGLIPALKPDLLHAHSPLLDGYPALWAGRRHGLKLIYEVRAFWEDAAADAGTASQGGLRMRATHAAETGLLRRADHVVALCQGVRDEIVGRGIPAERVTIVPNAIDIDKFPPGEAPDTALAERLGLAGATVLAFIGSFYPYEGLDLLLRALPRLRAPAPLKVLLVGGGPMDQELRQLAAELGLADRVIFTGRVKFEEVNRYYGLVDILVFPRRRMRLTDLVTPLKPIEAMAKKRLVLASDVGGHREMIEDGRTGFLFAADDVDALARRIEEALADRAAWPRYQAAGRAYVEAERVWQTVGRRYGAIFERLGLAL